MYLDVYILGSCDPYDCLGTVSSSSATYANIVAGYTYYIVVDADDGSGSAYDILVTMIVTGVGESLPNNTFNIYPNPTEDQFTISFNESIGSYHTVCIRNSLGQIVLELTAFDDQINVDISSFAKGVYVVSVAGSEGVETVKVFKF